MMFADISRPSPMEGEELFEDGKSIRFSAGLRQIFPGDLIMIEWPVDQSFGTGNWIKGGLVRIETDRVAPKDGRNFPVLGSTLDLEAGWQMGSFSPEVSANDSEGMCELVLVPKVKVSGIPWHWELRTDDVPGWNLFVVGHNCKLHDSSDICLADDRKVRADEARARRAQRNQ